MPDARSAHGRSRMGPGAQAEQDPRSPGLAVTGQEPPTALAEGATPVAEQAGPLQDMTEDGTDREAGSEAEGEVEGEAEEDCSAGDTPGDAKREGAVGSADAGVEADRGLGGRVLLQVSCFGQFAVTDGDREISPALAGEGRTSFKAWEVLAFLAAQPEAAAPRDKVISALWPEVGADAAANRLRVAMARLRAVLAHQVEGLPSEAVRCERDGTCRLDTRLISSDVHQFVALCHSASGLPREDAKAALQQARALHGGDLLPGRGSAYHGWVDERGDDGLSLREGYREEYYRATRALARLFSLDGRPDLAVPLYKDLLRAEPTLEDVVRELYRCYHQLGDLSSLIREDRHLREALREAYHDPDDPEDDPACYEPAPETMDLFRKIRAELETKAVARASRGDHRLANRV